MYKFAKIKNKKRSTLMILHVANPIYDSVFKYIMSDERISKTILSARLKKRGGEGRDALA